MKQTGLLFILMTLVSCDPYGFGFKKNPAYVLNEAFEAASSLDEESFLKVSGKEALCIYGNLEGLAYLKQIFPINPKSIERKSVTLNQNHHSNPVFVGFWSYYSERYQVTIIDKKNRDEIAKVAIDCDYGIEGGKDNKFLELDAKKYTRKECKLTKIIPAKGDGLPLPLKCDSLKVSL